jgi:Cof subfamily protein (haloacid dehalogenase superfamily)
VIRLVASDVDGTLLDHGTLPPARARAVRGLVAAGIPMVLATGKLWTSVAGLIEELELPGPHVACNGSVVFEADGRVVERTLLDAAVADEVVAVLRTRRIVHAVYLEDGTIVTDRVDPAHDVLPLLGEPLPAVAGHDGRGVIKVLAVVGPDDEGDLRRIGAVGARVQRTGRRFLEWNAPGADKATGLRTVADRLGVPLSAILAVGDAENDVPMLRAAGVGVAVADASPAAVAAADRVLRGDLADLLDELVATAAAVRA